MKPINALLGMSCLILSFNVLAQETSTSTQTATQTVVEVEPNTTQVEVVKTQDSAVVNVETPEAQSKSDDEWSLMTQLIEAKKLNEAKAKAQINDLTEENTELNVEVEEGKKTLAKQEVEINGLETQLGQLQTSAADIEARLAVMQEETDTVSYEFKKLQFKNTASKLTPFLYAATAVLISNQLDASQDTKLIVGLGAFSAGTLVESTDYGLSFQLTKLVYKK